MFGTRTLILPGYLAVAPPKKVPDPILNWFTTLQITCLNLYKLQIRLSQMIEIAYLTTIFSTKYIRQVFTDDTKLHTSPTTFSTKYIGQVFTDDTKLHTSPTTFSTKYIRQVFTDDTKLHTSPTTFSTKYIRQVFTDDTKLHTSPTSHLILNIQITGLV